MKRNLLKVSILAVTVLSLTACNPFSKDSSSDNTASPAATQSGSSVGEKIDTSSNSIAWADISAKLPRTFPEITVNGSSNICNVSSDYGITSVKWTNMTSDNLKEIQTYLEEQLKVKFEENGDVITASNVELSGTKYSISLSYSDDSDPAMITMNISSQE